MVLKKNVSKAVLLKHFSARGIEQILPINAYEAEAPATYLSTSDTRFCRYRYIYR